MICRIWRGWTSRECAADYQAIVRGKVIPAIEARNIPGFLQIDLLRDNSRPDEVEFSTLMWFESEAAIEAFMGPDSTIAHVPAEARAVLKRFDDRARHFDVLDRRAQT